MIGADGVHGRGIPKVARVDMRPFEVRVGIATPEGFSISRDFLHVRLENRGYGEERDFRLHIFGGNTNDGGIERYEQAIDAYSDAVKVAKRLQQVLDAPGSMFEGYDLGPEARRGVVLSFPDYVLGAWMIANDHPPVVYERGHEPEPGAAWSGTPIVGLDGLRDHVYEIAFGKSA